MQMKWPHRLSFKFALCGILLIAASSISLALFITLYHNGSGLIQLRHFLHQNQLILLLWRLALIGFLFFVWPVFIRYRARKHQWPIENIPKAISLRYWLVVLLLGMDVLFQYSAVGGQ